MFLLQILLPVMNLKILISIVLNRRLVMAVFVLLVTQAIIDLTKVLSSSSYYKTMPCILSSARDVDVQFSYQRFGGLMAFGSPFLRLSLSGSRRYYGYTRVRM